MDKSAFDFQEYKPYLHFRAGGKQSRRGIKIAMAHALKCQPTYVSQVLNGNADFSLEQAMALNRFFNHSGEESEYFLLLVQKDRSGTRELREHFERQLEAIRARRLVITQRLGTSQTLSPEDQSTYYSSWSYAAIHVALTVPSLQTREALSVFFQLPMKKVIEVLEFLCATGLARAEGSRFVTGAARIRLGNDSPNIIRHHANWRSQAIESLERETLTDLHYSAVFSLSEKDALRLKDRLLEVIRETLEVVKASPEETLYGYSLDLFHLCKNVKTSPPPFG